jgi:hypothetical protein
MKCLFIGGKLDGELREMNQKFCRQVPHVASIERPEITITTITVVPREYSEYTIANGIARHESVSEEEVARRVQRGMLGTLCREKQHA